MRKCPICGKEFREHPALSRKDNSTEICPQCGINEALFAYGMTDGTAHEVLYAIISNIKEKTSNEINKLI